MKRKRKGELRYGVVALPMKPRPPNTCALCGEPAPNPTNFPDPLCPMHDRYYAHERQQTGISVQEWIYAMLQ